ACDWACAESRPCSAQPAHNPAAIRALIIVVPPAGRSFWLAFDAACDLEPVLNLDLNEPGEFASRHRARSESRACPGKMASGRAADSVPTLPWRGRVDAERTKRA